MLQVVHSLGLMVLHQMRKTSWLISYFCKTFSPDSPPLTSPRPEYVPTGGGVALGINAGAGFPLGLVAASQ